MEERLKKFAKLIDAGTYTAAAQTLHTSQPALTTAIQKLERELKTPLLARGSRSLTMTRAGEVAYAHGHSLLQAERNLQHDLRRLEEKKQPVALGCIDSIASVLVQANLLPVLERDSELALTVLASHTLLGQLKRGQLDMAIVVEQPQKPTGTEERFLGNEKFVLVCRDIEAEAYTETARTGTLTDFLAYNHISNTYALLASQLQQNAITIEPRFYSTNPSVLLGLAMQGRGVAALPLELVAPYLGKGLVEIPVKKPLHRPIAALWRTGHKLPDSAEDFLDAVQIQLV